jgi:hypothetical protein
MPRSKINFDTKRKIGLTLPSAEESTAYGAPALKVCGKLLACVPTHRSAEPGSLADSAISVRSLVKEKLCEHICDDKTACRNVAAFQG